MPSHTGGYVQDRRSWQDINSFQICQLRNQGVGEAQTQAVVILEVPEKTERQNGERETVHGPRHLASKWRFAVCAFRKIGTAIEWTNDPNGSDEPIAFTYDRFEESLFRGIVPQSPANFADDVVDVPFGVNEKIRVPQLGLNFLAGDQSFPSPGQENEKFHGFLFKLYPAAIATEFVATQVKLDIATSRVAPGNLFHR